MKSSILFILIGVILAGRSFGQEEVKEYYEKGGTKAAGKIKDGQKEGKWFFYYPSGKLKEINYYVMGIAEKNWKRYDEAGNLLLTVTYKDNREYRINGEKVEFADEDIKLIQ